MRRAVLTAVLLGVAACGGETTRGKSTELASSAAASSSSAHPPKRIAEQPVEIVSMTRSGAVGALDRPSTLRRFFESLAKLEAGGDDDVRVVQFGDSHTAADVETAAIRRSLQARFGDGGRGFVAIGRPWKRYFQEGIRVGMSTEWAPDKAKVEHGKLTGDGMYGLAGIGLITRQHGARAWTDIVAKTARAELAYLEQPGGGSFDVLVDGMRLVRVSSRGERPVSAFRTFDVAESAPHQLEVRAVGDGDVRVYGVSLGRGQRGIVYDALGINGAQIRTSILTWSEPHWAEQLRHRSPSLVVLAYGTNESVEEAMPSQTIERHLVDALGRIARAVPTASCLLLGPPDRAVNTKDAKDVWLTSAKLVEIVAIQRRVAEAAGCAFYDQFLAMGGEGSIATWAAEEPPRAQRDRVHLTKEGYSQLGATFASDLMRAYAGWRRERGLPPTNAPSPEPAPNAPPPVSTPSDTSESPSP